MLSPSGHFSFLKNKGYCFQCLFRGADMSLGKHKVRWYQHDFACKHKLHHQYLVGKHVLVCQKHKDADEKKQLLEKYKQKCLRNFKLPTFAKNISLLFHAKTASSQAKMGLQLDPDVTLLSFPANTQRRFEAAESTGSYYEIYKTLSSYFTGITFLFYG